MQKEMDGTCASYLAAAPCFSEKPKKKIQSQLYILQNGGTIYAKCLDVFKVNYICCKMGTIYAIHRPCLDTLTKIFTR